MAVHASQLVSFFVTSTSIALERRRKALCALNRRYAQGVRCTRRPEKHVELLREPKRQADMSIERLTDVG